jgi:hypothetical protein
MLSGAPPPDQGSILQSLREITFVALLLLGMYGAKVAIFRRTVKQTIMSTYLPEHTSSCLAKMKFKICSSQGDQIGRNLAVWAIFRVLGVFFANFGRLLRAEEETQNSRK